MSKFFYDPNEEWLCSSCGCDEVWIKQWIGINSGDAIGGTEQDDICYCPKCDSVNIIIVTREEFKCRLNLIKL